MPDGPATPRPADRYGDRTGPRHRARVRAGLALLLAAGVALVAWIGLHQADRPVRADVVAFDLPTPTSLRAQVRVLKDEGATVVCRVVVRDAGASVVGAEELVVGPEAGGRTTVPVLVEASAPPVTAEVGDCREE
ncbi:DUF4307 domain-containing protein [Vallicoccus soli]|uniref:DUF4307 domain-containing protein n=1 Tax=Vallicoccus soli TaxID=2339232 RepID=UPI001403D0C2|nr:DUF4307 domain-containing protein [Vallicoccus soli]